ncbi:hypothetical protein Godav_019611 [Gossypium davidsonii]|uniref:Uncharacterized protein n=1 Tax=Gossypium davidsonii TaxID=34287 RepID=A0A7J8R160_GOSDV|nr:hypothetical protein [Gossypium davidsonii]
MDLQLDYSPNERRFHIWEKGHNLKADPFDEGRIEQAYHLSICKDEFALQVPESGFLNLILEEYLIRGILEGHKMDIHARDDSSHSFLNSPMRFKRNVSVDGMKERINAKIVRHYGRRMSKLFYKFPVLLNPIKFIEIELVYDEDMETMVALYCPTESVNTELMQLFAELADVEPVEDFTPLSE